MKPEGIYIICTPGIYEQARTSGVYTPVSLDSEGFIHASPADKLTRVANQYFSDQPELRILCLDIRRIQPQVMWEPITNGDLYPHLYGPLNMDAVFHVVTITPDRFRNKYDIRPDSLPA